MMGLGQPFVGVEGADAQGNAATDADVAAFSSSLFFRFHFFSVCIATNVVSL